MPFLGFRIRRTFHTEEIRPNNDVMDDDKSADEADFNDVTVMDDDDEDKNKAAADCGNRQLI